MHVFFEYFDADYEPRLKLVKYLILNKVPLECVRKCFEHHKEDKDTYEVKLDLLEFLIESETPIEKFDVFFAYYC